MNDYVKQRLQESQAVGSETDISALWKDGFQIWKKAMLPIICGTILVGLAKGLISIFTFPLTTGYSVLEFAQGIKDPYFMREIQAAAANPSNTLISLAIQFATVLIFAPTTAGFIKMCYDADRSNKIDFSVLFKYYKPEYYGKIVVIAIITFIFISVPSVFLMKLGILGYFLILVISSIVGSLMILAIPLVIFANASIGEAIKWSLSIASANFGSVFGFYLMGCVLIAIMLGLAGCCLGIIFTFCYTYITPYLLFKQIIGFEAPENEDEFKATPASLY